MEFNKSFKKAIPALIGLFGVFIFQLKAQEPFAVPTFHCMSLYWNPAGGLPEKKVLVSYKKTVDSQWLEGFPMRYNPIAGTSLDEADYRGSVVNLVSGTSYDFKLQLEGLVEGKIITVATRTENFPEADKVKVAAQSVTYKITSGGNASAYKVFDGQNNTIDVLHKSQNCIRISASYVIVRNFVLKGAGSGKGTWPYIGAIHLDDGVHDVIIEGCDISDFGRPHPNPIMANQGNNYDCGISFASGTSINIARITIQRNKIHHPTYTCNNSFQNGGDTYTHPEGAQGITMWNNKGNHIIRYNEFYSDSEHMYNDIISGGNNGSYDGVPGADTDVYCNYFSHSWDNAVELEGGGQNVHCWNNYMTKAVDMIGNAAVSIGPFYLWRNIIDQAEWTPDGNAGRFMKMGHAGDEKFMSGHMYIFNNTCFQTDGKGVGEGIGGGNRIVKHCVSRNNIIQLRSSTGQAISQSGSSIDNDFDYDLYNGSVPSGSEKHGLKRNPIYVPEAGYHPATKTGNFQLASTCSGYDKGLIIPNFTDTYLGNAPDMGAHENGTDEMQFGVNAVFGEKDPTSFQPLPENRQPKIQNYPNPFNSETTIRYELAEATDVKLNVYGLQGALINRQVDELHALGQYSVLWAAPDEIGIQVPCEINFYGINISEKNRSFSKMNKTDLVK